MAKKKNKVPKLTEEQYFAYIAGLKNDAALFTPAGDLLIPDELNKNAEKAKEKDY